MRRGGWQAAGFVTNRFFLPDFGFSRGFATWDFARSRDWRSRRAALIVDRALAWLDTWDGCRALLVIHLFDPHMPFEAPSPFLGSFGSRSADASRRQARADVDQVRRSIPTLDEEARQELIAAYDEEIAYVDAELGRLFESLRTRGLLDKSLIVLTSDHGEELFEHGGFAHGHAHWESVLRVPLLVWAQGLQPGRRAASVSLVDVFPTLLEAAGLPPLRGLDGRSLWPLLRGEGAGAARWVAAQGNLFGDRGEETVVRWPWKRTLSPESGQARTFDLQSDPHESVDLEDLTVEQARHLERLRRAVGFDAGPHIVGSTPKPDSESEAELRALGYLR